MAGYCIIGSFEAQNEYIDRYISEKKIKKFNVLEYSSPFSIKNAREVSKTLSLSLGSNEEKIIILPQEIKYEAQNALLKSLEELPEGITLLVRCDEKKDLLPTVLSRLFIIRLDKNQSPENESIRGYLDSVFKTEFRNLPIMLQCSKVFSEFEGDAVYEVLDILKKILDSDSKTRNESAMMIDRIYENAELYYSNNVNKRMFWDSVFLSFAKQVEK